MQHYPKIILTAVLSLLAFVVRAQEALPAEPAETSFYFGKPIEVQVALILLAFTLIIMLLLLVSMIRVGLYFRTKFLEEGKKLPLALRMVGIFSGDTTVLTGEYRDEVLHEYDGIYELDNDLPPWWKYLFYVTIVFAVIYMLHYHVLQTGDLQATEYEKEMAAAEEKYASVDLTYEAPETGSEALKFGEKVFIENCVACHGEKGEGNNIGPNLTDKYWTYGGDINTLYETIKYGRGGKMPEWGHLFSNKEIYHIASYVSSLYGTNPPNAKEPEGEIIYEPGGSDNP